MFYITNVQPDEKTIFFLKKQKSVVLLNAYKTLVASTISYITVNQSCLESDVFTVSLNKRLNKLLRDDDYDYLIDYHINKFLPIFK